MRRVIQGCVISVLLVGCAGGSDDRIAFRGETEGHETTTGKEETTGETTGKEETTGGVEGCTRTIGYWKNHCSLDSCNIQGDFWPIPEGTELCGSTWYEILWMRPFGDAWIILAKQWIGASLNAAAGATVPANVQDALDDAEALLAGCSISAEDRDEALAIKDVLDSYNNGLEGVDECD